MSPNASASSWKRDPSPPRYEILAVKNEIFLVDCAEKIRIGFVPRSMDDRWFVYFDHGNLYFHRSWTGKLVYLLGFEEKGDSLHLVQGKINVAAFEDIDSIDREAEFLTLFHILETTILGKEVVSPRILARLKRNEAIVTKLNSSNDGSKSSN